MATLAGMLDRAIERSGKRPGAVRVVRPQPLDAQSVSRDVLAIRGEIERGEYLTEHKLDVAAERLLADVRRDPAGEAIGPRLVEPDEQPDYDDERFRSELDPPGT